MRLAYRVVLVNIGLFLPVGWQFGWQNSEGENAVSAYDDLIERAKKLDIPVNSGVYKPSTDTWNELQITEYELHRRIREEERHRRENRTWKVAVFSAVIAVLAAAAAWWPMICARK